MNNWEEEMAKDAKCCGRKMDKRNETHYFDAEKYIVNYEIANNYYRQPTKWEKVRNTITYPFKRIKSGIAHVWQLAYDFMPFGFIIGGKCCKSGEIEELRMKLAKTVYLLKETESENAVLRDQIDIYFISQRKGWGVAEQKKKAAKKRPSSRKKSKG